MAKLHISLLGTFQVTTDDGRFLPIETGKAQALLAYLALEAHRPHPREALSTLFWPSASASKARASLRQALYTLRKTLEAAAAPSPTHPEAPPSAPTLFQSTRREVSFDGAGLARLDVTLFTEAVEACHTHAHRDLATCALCAGHLQRAIDVYRGDLLSDIELGDCTEFEAWRLERQKRLHGQALAALRHLATYYERQQDYARAADCLQRELALEPWREAAHRQLMRVLALSGQRAAAMEQYRTCSRVLAEELGATPSDETTDLYWQIEAGTAQPAYHPGPEVHTARPYKGLAAFTESDAADFYGRETFIGRLLLAVQRPAEFCAPVVALVGPSGSGKSSLVHAGLLPRLRMGGDWLVADLRLGARPFFRLVEVLGALRPAGERPTPTACAALAGDLRWGRRSLVEVIGQIPALRPGEVRPGTRAPRRLLIIVDAFEELYTLCREPACRRSFLDTLFGSTHDPQSNELPYTVLLTLRADLLPQVLSYPGMDHILCQELMILGQMSRNELRQAIEEPARSREVAFEPGLVRRLLDDVGDEPGNLPLLQFTLTRLWDRRQERLLTHSAYDEIGEVSGALAGYAEDVYALLSPHERVIARRTLTQMVRPEQAQDARRPVARSELSEREWALVRKLVDARLVVLGRDWHGNETAELVHEALIHAWERLRGWVEADQAYHYWLQRLRTAIRQWEAAGQDEGALLRGALLAEAEEWSGLHAGNLSEAQRAFIAAGVALRSREQHEAKARARTLERAAQLAQSLRLAANARLALRDDNTDLALALAWEASRVPDPPPESKSVLAEAAYAPGTRRVYRGHEAGVECLALSPDGRTMVSGSVDRTLILWELESGRALARFVGHEGTVYGAAFSPDGRSVLSASADQTLILWNLEGKIVRRFRGHADEVRDVAFVAPGAAADLGGAALSCSRDGVLIVWDVATGAAIRRLEGHEGAVLCADILPGGSTALSGSADSSLILWDLARGTALKRLPGRVGPLDQSNPLHGHGGFVQDVALVPHSAAERLYEGGAMRSHGAVAGPHGAALSVSDDQYALLWDLERGEVARRYFLSDITAYSVAVDVGGQRALVGSLGGSAYLLDLQAGGMPRRMLGHSGRIVGTAFHPDGRGAITASSDGTLRLWDLDSGAEIRRRAYDRARVAAMSVDVSPDERLGLTGFYDGSLVLWDVATGHELRPLEGHRESIFAGVRFGADGRTAISGSGDITAHARDNTVRLWDLATGAQLRCYEGHSDRLWSLARSPCGRYALSGSHDGTVRLWDLQAGAGKEAGRVVLDLSPQAARSVAFGPQGRFALVGPARGASSAPDYDLRRLDLETGRVRRLAGHHEVVTSIAVSPDGRRALSGAVDGTLCLWDLSRGELVRRLREHRSLTLQVLFVTDEIAVSSSLGGSVIVWDLATGKPMRRFVGHSQAVTGICLARGGQTVISVSADLTMREWRIDATHEALVAWIEGNRYVPEMTGEERAAYRVDLLGEAEATTTGAE